MMRLRNTDITWLDSTKILFDLYNVLCRKVRTFPQASQNFLTSFWNFYIKNIKINIFQGNYHFFIKNWLTLSDINLSVYSHVWLRKKTKFFRERICKIYQDNYLRKAKLTLRCGGTGKNMEGATDSNLVPYRGPAPPTHIPEALRGCSPATEDLAKYEARLDLLFLNYSDGKDHLVQNRHI
jgi:hypothetical protein